LFCSRPRPPRNNCTNKQTKLKHPVSNKKVVFGASMTSALKGTCETVGELLPWYVAGIRGRRLCTTNYAVIPCSWPGFDLKHPIQAGDFHTQGNISNTRLTKSVNASMEVGERSLLPPERCIYHSNSATLLSSQTTTATTSSST
jgi:hypothetical protein